MAQFDVHRNADPRTRIRFPFLVDIQSDLLYDLAIRVVIPLTPVEILGAPIGRLNPRLEVMGKSCALATTHIAGVSKSVLGPVVANLAESRDQIVAAIDVVISGI